MTTPIWPPELPQLQSVGLTSAVGARAISFQVGAGPNKRRVRSTMALDAQSTPMDLTGAQLQVLRAFYRDTLLGGTLPFEWTDFVTGETRLFRFAENGAPAFKLETGALDPAKRWYSGTITLETV